MTQNSKRNSSRIARRAVKQGARPVVCPQAAVEKLATDGTTSNVPLMKGTKKVLIGTMNVQTLRRADKISELIASSGHSHQDIVCIQEHRFIHEELPTKEHAFGTWKLITCSAWKNNANASVDGVGILLNPLAYKASASIEKITDRIMVATFLGNPQTMLICCYSPTNVSDENEVDNFYEVLESVTRSVPKYNLLIIGEDFNVHLGQHDGFKFAYHHQSNLIINNKWRNSAKNCRAFNSFVSVSPDHRVISARLRLTLRANKKKINTTTAYDWSVLRHNTETRQFFITTVTNRFALLQDSSETVCANNTYQRFEKACKEAATSIIPQKAKAKKRKPWENDDIRQKRDLLRKRSQLKESLPSPENIQRLSEARSSLKDAYETEQTNYLNRKISHIRNSVTNKR